MVAFRVHFSNCKHVELLESTPGSLKWSAMLRARALDPEMSAQVATVSFPRSATQTVWCLVMLATPTYRPIRESSIEGADKSGLARLVRRDECVFSRIGHACAFCHLLSIFDSCHVSRWAGMPNPGSRFAK